MCVSVLCVARWFVSVDFLAVLRVPLVLKVPVTLCVPCMFDARFHSALGKERGLAWRALVSVILSIRNLEGLD